MILKTSPFTNQQVIREEFHANFRLLKSHPAPSHERCACLLFPCRRHRGTLTQSSNRQVKRHLSVNKVEKLQNSKASSVYLISNSGSSSHGPSHNLFVCFKPGSSFHRLAEVRMKPILTKRLAQTGIAHYGLFPSQTDFVSNETNSDETSDSNSIALDWACLKDQVDHWVRAT